MISVRLQGYIADTPLFPASPLFGCSYSGVDNFSDVNPNVTEDDLLKAGLRHCRTSLRQAQELGVVFS